MSSFIALDSCVLIEHFRTKDKRKTLYSKLLRENRIFCISSAAKLEVLIGVNDENLEHWDTVFRKMLFLPFNELCVDEARKIGFQLKRVRRSIDLADLFIAATSLANGLPLATLNRKHFEGIDGLELIVPE